MKNKTKQVTNRCLDFARHDGKSRVTEPAPSLRRGRASLFTCLLLTACCLLPTAAFAQTTEVAVVLQSMDEREKQMLDERTEREKQMPAEGTELQSIEEREKQMLDERRRLQEESDLQTRAGTFTQPPNPGSIHVNRDLTYRNYTPRQLVENVFVKSGACASISNVQLRTHGWNGSSWTHNDDRGLGYFTRGTSNFEFAEGLVLSTGGLVSIEGPNRGGSQVTSVLSNTLSDPDLQALLASGGSVTNVTVLTFNFVPTSRVIQFRYIFASEEYLDYVADVYNDVFGFFISGPGISGNQNIARLPTTTTGTNVVSINNVNGGKVTYANHNCPTGANVISPAVNRQYYINNPMVSSTCGTITNPYNNLPPAEVARMMSMEFNGRTVALTASATVTPCQTYTLKLAVGNVFDQAVQSGVFLEAYSLDTDERIINYGNGIRGLDVVYRGCATNYFVVTRPNPDPTPSTVTLTYGGTAINGVDVNFQFNPLPTSVVIPAGATSVMVQYAIPGTPNTDKIFTITASCPCPGTGSYTKTIYIYNASGPSDMVVVTTPACPGTNSGRIFVDATTGSGVYEISIDGGTTWFQSDGGPTGFLGLAAGTYTIRIRDKGSCASFLRTGIVIGTASTVSAGANQTGCSNVFTMTAQPLRPGQSGHWTVVSGAATVTDILNPRTNVTISGTSATLRWTLSYSEDCQVSGTVTLTRQTAASVTLAANSTAVCSGSPSTLTATVVGANLASTTYTWYRGTTSLGTTAANTYSTGALTATGSYSVQINDGSCTGTSNTVTVTVNPVPPLPTVPNTSATLCHNATAPTIAALTGASVTNSSSYTLRFYNSAGSTITGTTTVPTTTVGTQTYSVAQHQTSTGCESNRTTVTVVVQALPAAPTVNPVAAVCSGSTFSITVAPVTAGHYYRVYANSSGGTPLQQSTVGSGVISGLVAPAASTTYHVSAVSAAGCESATRTAVSIPVTPSVTPSLTITAIPH